MRRALIVGGDGVFGRALRSALAAHGLTVQSTSRRSSDGDALFLDLAIDPLGWVPQDRPDIVFLCAAVTNMAECARDPVGSRTINVVHTLTLVRTLAALGSRIVYPSTNLVLAGASPFQRADAPVRPLGEYAAQKAEVENALRPLGDKAVVLRMTKVISPASPLVSGWVEALRSGRPIRPFSDQVLAPIPLAGLVDAFVKAGLEGDGGIYQVTGAEDISYAEFAARIAARFGYPAGLVKPAPAAELGIRLEAQPRYTTLDPTRARRDLGISPFELDETLTRMILDAS